MTYSVGRGRPPPETRFPTGTSGNSKGRPKGSGKRRDRPFENVFSQLIKLQVGGEERMLRADEAYMLAVAQIGARGKPAAKRAALAVLRELRPDDGHNTARRLNIIFAVYADLGDVNNILNRLGAAKTLFVTLPIARFVLEPWAVQAGLDRLGDRRLGEEEQQVVLAATRRPQKVNWPDWWAILPGDVSNLES